MKKLPCGRDSPEKPHRKASEKDILQWHEKLETYLTENKLKQSESRNKIIEVILEEREHFQVQVLCDHVRERFPEIGPATIYRNLPLFCDIGLLQETFIDSSGQKIYEVSSTDHHDHIVCLDCDAIFEFHDEKIELAQTKITQAYQFSPVAHRHVIYARCMDLRKKA